MASNFQSGLTREIVQNHKTLFNEFINAELPGGVVYKEKILQAMREKKRRVIINLNDFRQFDEDNAKRLLLEPHEYLAPFTQALQDFVKFNVVDAGQLTLDTADLETDEWCIGIEGSFGSHHVSPRGLTTQLLRNLVCVEGIVTKSSSIKPKIVKSVHYCEATKAVINKYYRDETSSGLSGGGVFPTHDSSNPPNPLTFEFGLSNFKDTQLIHLQEMPERAPAGQLPRSVVVYVENDLVDVIKPGDRVRVYGVYRALPHDPQGFHTKGIFSTSLTANNIQHLSKEVFGPQLTPTDILKIKEVAARPDCFARMARSLAPSIYGHEYIKQAVMLLLLGGVEKVLENGTHLRGDINILLIGDPSTAKSQLLRFVLNTAPLAVSTSGRGSSGVGLTAAVTRDPETRERRLEAGAMVLADRGVVCIDEFDKMDEDDRVAIHEVMEQQTVTIAKAGIHASLNARCSVLAAANPIYGKYDRSKKPAENIALPDSLLSRFDLLFIVLDNLEPGQDRAIATHVLKQHRIKPKPIAHATEADVVVADDEEAVAQKVELREATHGIEVYSIPFIQKFLLYVKTFAEPNLSEEAEQCVIDAFEDFRSRQDVKTLPVTPRMIETMIRLGTAHAKCRLSTQVSAEDIQVALQVMQYALYHDTELRPKPNAKGTREKGGTNANNSNQENPKPDGGDDSQSRGGGNEGGKDDDGSSMISEKSTSKRKRAADADPEPKHQPKQKEQKRSQQLETSSQGTTGRYGVFTAALLHVVKENRAEIEVNLDEVVAQANQSGGQEFGEEEVAAMLERLEAEQKISVVDGNTIYL